MRKKEEKGKKGYPADPHLPKELMLGRAAPVP